MGDAETVQELIDRIEAADNQAFLTASVAVLQALAHDLRDARRVLSITASRLSICEGRLRACHEQDGEEGPYDAAVYGMVCS
jgi:hypothetical protein